MSVSAKVAPLSADGYTQALNRTLVTLLKERQGDDADFDHYLSDHVSSSDRRRIVRSLLTVRSPFTPLPSSTLSDIDSILSYERSKSDDLTLSKDIPRLSTLFNTHINDAHHSFFSRVSVWRGDITTLSIDAIVNAANSQLLGCFQPKHLCIDNVIHAAAGPRLRDECYQLMKAQVGDETNGKCKITKGYSLPARYVLHTVGPQLTHKSNKNNDDDDNDERVVLSPSPQDESDLRSCYNSCMEAAYEKEDIHSLAFCCISTGLFGFPQDKAVEIAVETVRKWMLKKGADKKIEHVVFNVFTDKDEGLYMKYFARIASTTSDSPSSSSSSSSISIPRAPSSQASLLFKQLSQASQWLNSSTSIIISGAAGLSASAGLDYTSESIFKSLYPAMHKRGHRCMYEFIGYTDWTPAEQWGYLFTHCYNARYHWPQHIVYQNLKKICERKGIENTFILTSNADGMFEQNGFDRERIYTIQGEYGYMQCLKPCSETSRWPTTDFMNRALPYINEDLIITNEEVIPKCKSCGGPVMFNVRGGDWFIEKPFFEQKHAYRRWMYQNVDSNPDAKLVIIEIGAGFNTPSVLRWPNEALAKNNPKVKLIRINMQYPTVPMEITGDKAIGISCDAVAAVTYILNNMSTEMKKD